MGKAGKASSGFVAAGVFALGLGLGWAGATHRAIDASRARDGGGFVAIRDQVDAEEMRLLDLGIEQRRVFQAAKDEMFLEADRIFARLRPEMELLLARFDKKVRPILSPRQLAVYDRLEQKRRQEMPQAPVAADN